jgi:hypothetical protein
VATATYLPQQFVALKTPLQAGQGVRVSFDKHFLNNNAAFIVTAHHAFSGRLRIASLTVITAEQGEQDVTGVECTVVNGGSAPVSYFYINLVRIRP